MTVSPALRKATLTAHVAVSVGWLGAVVVVLALGVAVLTSADPGLVSGSYLVMDWLGWSVLVPLAAGSLLTGVVVALGTTWGLLRHYWVVVKLVLTVAATAVLLLYTGTLDRLAASAMTGAAPVRSASPLVHSAAALAVLLLALVLSVYKPRGLTRRGWRIQQEQKAGTPTRSAHSPPSGV